MLATLRFWFRLTIAFIVRFRGILFMGVVFGFFIFIGLTFLFPLLTQSKTEYIGMTGRYTTEDLPEEVIRLIGNGLTKIDKDGKVVLDLAKEIEEKEKGKIWIFRLRDDIYWHDGTKVDSKTINYSFPDVTVTKLDEKTIMFELKNPFSAFGSVVSRPIFSRGLLGTGEWRVKKLTTNGAYVERITLQNNQKQKKEFRFFPNEERTKFAFKYGQIDYILDLINPSPLEKWNTAVLTADIRKDRFVGIFLNNSDPTIGDNKSLRQALSYAIDKDGLMEERVISPIHPDSWVYNPQVKRYDYDPEHARELLRDVPKGILDGLNIQLVTIPVLLETAEKVAKYWEEIGVKSIVKVSSNLPDEYQALLVIYDIPKDPDQYSIWHSTQSETNISKYSNPRIDKLLEDGRLETDEQQRKKIYLDFQRFLLEDAPVIMLYHPVSYQVERK
ncbi:hypothetical protein A2382_02615 [Candidatus Woesebacteria bacterium RIFOXYB1_FULL_38_16]|uniref:Solute-binding protein family 5 domain-containing protein n=1 Tax=Candidatus Woesebacteria bacterium RIFOXYB1_FULL_38_16 TaxID=1802538 RepID=A0A1F8CRD0_9BACT|nr:MAG: hypothetical protein A2382_02615 [Candidatus Woesebacteria bacterium RIFOXYB1_FULL_38_16]